MMITIEARTLQEAITKASQKLGCSITQMSYEVVQHEKKGFLGLGRKDAKIVALLKEEQTQEKAAAKEQEPKSAPKPETAPKTASVKTKEPKKPVSAKKSDTSHAEPQKPTERKKERAEKKVPAQSYSSRFDSAITESLYGDKVYVEDVIEDIKQDINHLFSDICFELDSIQVQKHDENTVYIEFKGPDAALLIGKEGYRYKALSYMLFNWINSKYGFMIRLEIAEFLKNQEEMIRSYLVPVITNIEKHGKGQTRPLDGVLAHIALKQLREQFPNKYVSFRKNSEGERYVIVNEFLNRNQ